MARVAWIAGTLAVALVVVATWISDLSLSAKLVLTAWYFAVIAVIAGWIAGWRAIESRCDDD